MGEQTEWRSPQALMRAARARQYPRETGQTAKPQNRYNYRQGPMYYLGQQILRSMQDAGYPAKILWCYRSPQEQEKMFAKRPKVTNARAWQSAHQYWEAVDIIHPTLAWDVTEEYWETLATCVRIVAEKFDVDLNHGHTWKFRDSAHIELRDWRTVRDMHRVRHKWDAPEPLTAYDLWQRFEAVLPEVAKAWVKRGGLPPTEGE